MLRLILLSVRCFFLVLCHFLIQRPVVPFGVTGYALRIVSSIYLHLARFYRYLWFFARIAASLTYRPIPLPKNPTYIASEDVTIIVPTIDAGEEFKDAAHAPLQDLAIS